MWMQQTTNFGYEHGPDNPDLSRQPGRNRRGRKDTENMHGNTVSPSSLVLANPAGGYSASADRVLPMRENRPQRAVKILLSVILALFLALCAAAAYFYFEYAPVLAKLRDARLNLNKPMVVTLTEPFPVKTVFNQDFAVTLDTVIPVRFPVSADLRVPINETFTVPLDDTFFVELAEPVELNDSIHVKFDLPIDTVVTADFIGFKKKVPIKATVPIDFHLPLKQKLNVGGKLAVHMEDPVTVQVHQDVEAPIDFIAEGALPLKTSMKVPISEELDCLITAPEPLPLLMDLDLAMDDWNRGLTLVEAGTRRAATE